MRLWPAKAQALSNPILSRRLRTALFICFFAVLILATIAAAVTAYLEASDVQDETLLSVAQLVRNNQIEVRDDTYRRHDHDTDDGVQVWALSKRRHGRFPIKPSLSDGFHTVGARGELWRIYLTGNRQTETRYAVVQKLAVKTEMAMNSALNTALPLIGLFLLAPLLVTLVVRHSFKPLNRIGRTISDSDTLDLDLSSREDIPLEVLPFVSSIESLLQKNNAYNQRQQRFIADAAHELRTPITALSLEIDNLQRAANNDARHQRELALKASTRRLQRLVNQLLDLARAQALDDGQTSTVNLNALVRDQIADLYAIAEDRDLEIVVEPNDEITLRDKNNQLQHLVRNALSNAIKFSPMAGVIRVELRKQVDHAIFTISDEGPGVDDEHLQKLHEPFYRPIEQATSAGAGLGLAICHEIARQLQGKLTLSNGESGGFRFHYEQPLISRQSESA